MATITKGTISKSVVSKANISVSELLVLDDGTTSVITSAGSFSVNENVDADTAVYTATARDPNGVTSGFSFAISTGDSSDFTINSSTGAVTIDASPNFEAQPSYSFKVTATKSGQPTATKDVTIAVNNLDEVVPTITSGATATAIAENSGAGQVIYTVTADDSSDVSGGVTFALSNSQSDSSLFGINSTTGAVTLTANPDFETKPSYTFAVVATDAAGNSSTPSNVTLAITNIVEISAPTWTSATHNIIASESTATNAEFVDLDTLISNPDGATITGFTFLSGNPGGQFGIVSSNALKLNTTLNHSAASSHALVIRMNYDLDGASGSTNIQININVAQNPVFTSSTSGEIYYDIEGYTTPVFYRPATTLDSNASSVTYSVGGTDQNVLSAINASDSYVQLASGATSHASKNSYSFTVTATDNLGGVTTTGALTATIVENRFAANAINTRGTYYQNDINKVDVAAVFQLSGNSRTSGLLGHARSTNYENNLIAIDRTNPSGTQSTELLTLRADSDFNARYSTNNLLLQAQRDANNPSARYTEGETYRTDFVFFRTTDTFDFGDGNTTYRMDPDHADYEITAVGHSAEPRVYLNSDNNPTLRNSVRFYHSTDTSGIAALATNCPTGTELVIYENNFTDSWHGSGLDITTQSDLGRHAWIINNGNGTISFAKSPSDAAAGVSTLIASHVTSYNNSNAMKFLNVTHTQPHYVTAVDEGPLVLDGTGATASNPFQYFPNDAQTITPFDVTTEASDLYYSVLTTNNFSPFNSNITTDNFRFNGNLILQSGTAGDGTMVMAVSTTTGLATPVINFHFEEQPAATLTSQTSLNYVANASTSSVIYTAVGSASFGGGATITYSLSSSTSFINSSNGSSVTPTIDSSTGEVTVPANTTGNGSIGITCSGSGLGSTTTTVSLYADERTDIEDTWKSVRMRPTGGINPSGNHTSKPFHVIDIPYSDTFDPNDTHYLIFKGTTINSPQYTNDVSIGWVQIFDASGTLVQSIAPEQGLWNTSKDNTTGTTGGYTLDSKTVQQAVVEANRAIGTGNSFATSGTYPNGVDGNNFSGWQRLPTTSTGTGSSNTGASNGVENSAYKLSADGGSNVTLSVHGDEILSQVSNTGHVFMETSKMAQNAEHYLRTVNAFLPPDGGTIKLAVHYASVGAVLTDSDGVLDVAFAKV